MEAAHPKLMGASRPPVLRRRLRDERGVTLVTALLVLSLFSVAGATAVLGGSASFRSSARSAADHKALGLAEAGVGMARATLWQAPDPRDPNAVPLQTVSMEGGTVTYSGSYSNATSTWTLTGTATLPDPTATVPLTQSVSSQVLVTTGSSGGQNNGIWNYIYADDTTTCTVLHDNIQISVAFYARGNICIYDNASITAAAQRVQVGGTVTINNTGSIGASISPLQEVDVGGGCKYGAGALHNPCSAADKVYATTITSTTQVLTKPPVDLAASYQSANPGPSHPCTTGSFPGGFDTDGVLNRTRPTVNLAPAAAYDCRVIDAGGNIVGRISWTPGNPGILTVAGMIFFDGDLHMHDGVTLVYQGKATIYFSGTIELNGNVNFCGVSGCTSSWDPNVNLIALVAGSSTDPDGVHLHKNVVFQGAVYAVNDFREHDNASVWGPIISRQVHLYDNATNRYVPFGTLLPGMPSSDGSVTVLQNVADSFTT